MRMNYRGLGALLGLVLVSAPAFAYDASSIVPITKYGLAGNFGTAAGVAQTTSPGCARSNVKNYMWALNQPIPSNGVVSAALTSNSLEGARAAVSTLGFASKLIAYSNHGVVSDGVNVVYGDEQPRQFRQPVLVKLAAPSGCPWAAAKSPTWNGSYWQISFRTNSLGVVTEPVTSFMSRLVPGDVPGFARNGDWNNYVKEGLGYITRGTNWTNMDFYYFNDGEPGGCMVGKADTALNWLTCGFQLRSERLWNPVMGNMYK